MARAVPADLQTLLDSPKCETHSTLDLLYSDSSATQRHYATVPLTYGAVTYTARLKKIGDIKQGITRAADRVRVSLRNSDNVVSADVASALRYYHHAEAIVGRHYSASDEAVTHLSELFRGRVMSPEVTEKEVSFDIVDSLVAAGVIIGSRPLTIKCPFRFKDINTCAYSGIETTCNKMPNSRSGCKGRVNTGRFGGWFWPYPIVSTPPAGNTRDPEEGGVGLPCFRAGTMISMADGTLREIQDVRVGDSVLCFYPEESTGRDVIAASVVDKIFEHDVYENFDFTLEDGTTLPVTAEHPLYVGRGAFRQAGYTQLKQKLQCLHRDLYGSYELRPQRVAAMRWDNEASLTDVPVKVYNFHVRGCETYFANGVAVHNRKID